MSKCVCVYGEGGPALAHKHLIMDILTDWHVQLLHCCTCMMLLDDLPSFVGGTAETGDEALHRLQCMFPRPVPCAASPKRELCKPSSCKSAP